LFEPDAWAGVVTFVVVTHRAHAFRHEHYATAS